MALPDFLNKLINKKKDESQYFLALEIKKGVVKAAVWQKTDTSSTIIGTSEKETSENWEEILVKADEAITDASGSVDQEKINKTIFGLPEYWITEGKINKEILAHLKKLCGNLTLTPLGFVITTESIQAYLQKLESAPLTAILVDITTRELAVSISRVGKIQTTKIIPKKETGISQQLAEILKELPEKDILPSRIILFDGHEDLEAIKQELISFPWTQRASFLHFPKVEILPKNSDIEGLMYLGAREMGTDFTLEAPTTFKKEDGKPEITPPTSIPENTLVKEETQTETPYLLGFIEDRDILETLKEEKPVITYPEIIKTPKLPEPEILINEPLQKPITPKVPIKLPEFSLKDHLPDFSGILSALPGKFVFLAGMVILLILSAGTIWGYWQFSSADVRLFVRPEVLEKEAEIIVNPNAESVNPDKNEIPAKILDIEETGTQKAATTGEKTVGEKAKGEVTLYNKTTTGSKNFKTGTILIGPENKQFIIDSDITIPVATSETEGITFGKVNVKVTAIDIGTQYNLPSGKKEFSVKEYPSSSYNAITDGAFSGGSSRKIKIVAESDQTKLLSALTKKLAEKAKTDFSGQLQKNQKLIEESVEIVSDQPKYSAEVDAEANEISLTDKIKYKAFAYDEKDIKEILKEVMLKSVTKEYTYEDDKTTITIKDKKALEETTDENKGAIVLTVVLKTQLIPKIDLNKFREDVSGKNEATAKSYIESLPNVVGYEADVSPKLPSFLFAFPRNAKNIKVTIVTK